MIFTSYYPGKYPQYYFQNFPRLRDSAIDFFASLLEQVSAATQLGQDTVQPLSADAAKSVHVILADDDSDDRELFAEAVGEISSRINVTSVENGVALMKLLDSSAAPLPAVLFLDINMPGKTGMQCLREIRSNPSLQHLPIVMYSTSTLQKDITDSHVSGAQFYIRKPNNFREAISLITKVFETDFDSTPMTQPLNNFIIS